jgi:hypothetical protein
VATYQERAGAKGSRFRQSGSVISLSGTGGHWTCPKIEVRAGRPGRLTLCLQGFCALDSFLRVFQSPKVFSMAAGSACKIPSCGSLNGISNSRASQSSIRFCAKHLYVAYAMRSAACFQSEGLVGTMGIEFIRPQNLKEFRGICRSRTSLAVLDRNYC